MANVLIVSLLPSSVAKEFTQFYVISNAVFSFFVYYQFATEVKINYIKYGLTINTVVYAASIVFYKEVNYIFYPYFVLIAEYLASQTKSDNWVLGFRIISTITVLPLIDENINFDNFLELRILSYMCVSFYLISSNKEIRKLAIKAKWTFVFWCYLSYTLPLYLVARFSESTNELKIWYVAIQLGIAFQIKIYEFSSRGAGKDAKLIVLGYVVLTLTPFAAAVLNFSVYNLMIYFMAVIFALKAGDYVKNEVV